MDAVIDSVAKVARPAVASVVRQIAQPFPQPQLFGAMGNTVITHHINMLPVLLFAIWACGALIVILRWAQGWWHIRAAVRVATPLELAAQVPVLCSSALSP